MNHQLIISNQLKLVLLSSCRLPCGRIIFQSFVIPLFHVFFLAVFPAAGGVDAFVPFCSDDSVFLNAALFLSRASDARSLAAAAPTC